MENRRRAGRGDPPPPPPLPLPSPSPSLLRDVSNYKTPRPQRSTLHNPPSPCALFFTASKNTQSASAFRRRPSVAPSAHSKAARRLRAFELEQSRSARRAQARREKALRSFSRSLSAWLNFLFRFPGSCGCNVGCLPGNQAAAQVCGRGKRNSLGGAGNLGVEGAWRCPKRPRGDCQKAETMASPSTSKSTFSSLQVSLKDVCSFEDLKERMDAHLSQRSCQEVFSIMSQVTKNIDEGRLKVKAHCPIVTDVGLRERGMKVLMCYNPTWLRVGLYIILGGDSLLQTEKGTSASEDKFIKMVIERQFFSHAGLAKTYAYNKLVDGIYRPGYFEALGSIILKRFLLLVLLLDKAKCERTLPVKYGIDGIDGGSPLLFCQQSHIKSSQQVIHGKNFDVKKGFSFYWTRSFYIPEDRFKIPLNPFSFVMLEFLSEVMHGEGDLLAHLVIVGYKVAHQQSPLAEYNFHVVNLFEDLQDGVLLCRTIQLLLCDSSVLPKLMIPSDSQKKNVQNCNVALQYLNMAGVPLSDEDGVLVVAEDVASGDRELILSLLWNIFVHLQVPLLIKKSVLIEEIAKVRGCHVDLSKCNRCTHMELLLEWIQAVTERYHIKVDTVASLVDGKALHCLACYYLRHQGPEDKYNGEPAPLLDNQESVAAHNIAFVQHVIRTLGTFPEVLQVSDILDEDASYDERSMIILLVFLASQLLLQQEVDHVNICQLIHSSYQSPSGKTSTISTSLHCQDTFFRDLSNAIVEQDEKTNYEIEDHAAMIIQCHFRGLMARKNFLKVKTAAQVLQAVMRARLAVTRRDTLDKVNHDFPFLKLSSDICTSSSICRRYYVYMIDRQVYVNVEKSVRVIQKAVRSWIAKRNRRSTSALEANTSSVIDGTTTTLELHLCNLMKRSGCSLMHTQVLENEAIFDDSDVGQEIVAVDKQDTCGGFILSRFPSQQHSAAIIIQSHWRGWLTKQMFLFQMRAVVMIQNGIQVYRSRKAFKQLRLAAIVIQQAVRGQIVRSRLLGSACLPSSRLHFGSCSVIKGQYTQYRELKMVISSIQKVQRWWRQILLLKARMQSAVFIQSCIRGFFGRRLAARMQRSIAIIQKWWRNILAVKLREKSVLIIQSHARGWIAREGAARERLRIAVIQAYWKGYLVRKCAKKQLLDLRFRIQKAAANVEDDMRLLNRLLSAVSVLLSHKSISNLRHTCSTISTATEHSQICCETLVNAGVIVILLKAIQMLTRSGPDQEVLKQILSILRNIARYPSLSRKLIGTPHSVEIIFQEFLRNKSEGYFVASELLKKLFAIEEGREVVRNLQGHVRRLHVLIQDLERKVDLQKRNSRIAAAKGDFEQRLKAALAVLQSTQGTDC